MEVLTTDEARRWCKRDFGSLRLTNEDRLYYRSRRRLGFMIRIPAEFRKMAFLSHDLLSFTGGHDFEGGLLWLQRWDIGANRIIRVGWQTLENIRRAHGSMQSLEVAPVQVFRSDEFNDFHAFLLYTMAYEWSGFMLPRNGGFFLDIRASSRLFCMTETPEVRKNLLEHLKTWDPKPEDHASLIRQGC
jgi:hypothetical protein